jgi:hypothetical protein
MAKGRENIAESLLPVLEFFRARQQTGLLSIERVYNGMLEEGEIYLRAGRPIYAATGQISGQDALNRLLNWHQIRFAFLPNAPYPPAPANPYTSMPRVTPLLPGVSQTNGELPMATDRVNDDAAGYIGISPAETIYKPGLEWLIPQRLSGDLRVLEMLTRRQRSVYLLVDGKRTIADLARCTGKTVQEIERVLVELQEQGLLTI